MDHSQSSLSTSTTPYLHHHHPNKQTQPLFISLVPILPPEISRGQHRHKTTYLPSSLSEEQRIKFWYSKNRITTPSRLNFQFLISMRTAPTRAVLINC
jgi:hypothetical protein